MSAAPDVAAPLAARITDLGDGLQVRRLLPLRERRLIGAWCFLDHIGPLAFPAGGGLQVGPHPHIGLQTFTWMIEGELLHRDSLGYAQWIRPGQVNLMTAGRGIAHAEESPAGPGRVHAAQLWIALPEAQRHAAPAFVHHAQLPQVDWHGLEATVLVGEWAGARAPVASYTPLLAVDLLAPDARRTELPLRAEFEHGLAVLQGEARVAGVPLAPGALLPLAPGRRQVALECAAGTRLLLLGGTPFEEAPLLWWNFVARDPDEIRQAAADWNAGRRFGTVADTALPRIPAPEAWGIRAPGAS